MATVVNPSTLTWTNPTTFVDGTSYGQANNAGYQLTLDGAAAVSIPLAWGTSFDLTSLAAFKALKSGNHTVGLAAVSKGGVVSAFSTASFSVDTSLTAAPSPVTNLAVS